MDKPQIYRTQICSQGHAYNYKNMQGSYKPSCSQGLSKVSTARVPTPVIIEKEFSFHPPHICVLVKNHESWRSAAEKTETRTRGASRWSWYKSPRPTFGVRILLGILLTTASSKARELDFAGFQEGGSAGGYPGGFGQARWHRF